jgi:putative ABC transport system ATP-binding protein
VLSVLERINRELGTTTAIITHNAPIAAIAHRVITLADGQIIKTEVPRRCPAASSGSSATAPDR